MVKVYDYVTISDSDKKTEIIFAYAKPEDDIRKALYLHDKIHGIYQKVITTTYGEEITEHITADEFAWNLGGAVGTISAAVNTT